MTIDTAKERERLVGLAGHTGGPWRLCAHLKGPEIDASCGCGYRGAIYGPNEDHPHAICQPGHGTEPMGEEGLWPVRYPREVELANARLIAAAPNLKRGYLAALDVIDAQAAEIGRLRATVREALQEAHAFIASEYRDPRSAALEGECIASEARPVWAKVCAARAALSEREP